MSAGTRIAKLTDVLRGLLPHATSHPLRCPRRPCTCGLERAIATAVALLGERAR